MDSDGFLIGIRWKSIDKDEAFWEDLNGLLLRILLRSHRRGEGGGIRGDGVYIYSVYHRFIIDLS